jgi:tungstate transport system ATP-binding protein
MSMRALVTDLPIRLDRVTVSVRGAVLLDSVTLQIESGAPTILIGPNGSGKTSLLHTAMGLLAPTLGHVTWGGVEKSPPSRRAFVFQHPVMLRRTVADNLRYALRVACVPRTQHDARIEELLTLVGLESLGRRPARQLSGGEQQRLALARALARNPAVLFLDEPTASLDPASTKAIEDMIGAVAASGIKVVMSTHDLAEARRLGGDIVLLHRGRVIERGTVPEFFVSPQTAEAKSFITGDLLL